MQMPGLIQIATGRSMFRCAHHGGVAWIWPVDTSASLSWNIQLSWRTDIWLERHQSATRL
jgi:hypothetical protein